MNDGGRFFFYGTLIDPEVLEAVLRRPVGRMQRRTAVVEGYRCVYRRGACYPVLVPDATAQAAGIFVSALTTRDVAFLKLYEGPDYDIREVPVRLSGCRARLVRANVFVPGPECEASSEAWTLEDWRRRFRQAFIRRVRSSDGSASG
jgi:hypothetical protein